MAGLKKILHFILYSNLWIALAAVSMVAKTQYLLGGNPWVWHPMYGFVFCATLFIYAGHRVVSLQKTGLFQGQGRYKIISQFRHHITTYALLGLIGTVVFAFQLSWNTWYLMLIPAFLSLAYVFPIFKRGKQRLRDINDVKIFFVALVWAVVAVVLPFVELQSHNYYFLLGAFLEVFLFVFAITIPFDIRDLQLDRFHQVQTLPSRLSISQAKRLSYLLLLLSFISMKLYLPYLDNTLTSHIEWSYFMGYILTLLLLVFSHPKRPDYYYTGLLDGTMIVLPMMVICASYS